MSRQLLLLVALVAGCTDAGRPVEQEQPDGAVVDLGVDVPDAGCSPQLCEPEAPRRAPREQCPSGKWHETGVCLPEPPRWSEWPCPPPLVEVPPTEGGPRGCVPDPGLQVDCAPDEMHALSERGTPCRPVGWPCGPVLDATIRSRAGRPNARVHRLTPADTARKVPGGPGDVYVLGPGVHGEPRGTLIFPEGSAVLGQCVELTRVNGVISAPNGFVGGLWAGGIDAPGGEVRGVVGGGVIADIAAQSRVNRGLYATVIEDVHAAGFVDAPERINGLFAPAANLRPWRGFDYRRVVGVGAYTRFSDEPGWLRDSWFEDEVWMAESRVERVVADRLSVNIGRQLRGRTLLAGYLLETFTPIDLAEVYLTGPESEDVMFVLGEGQITDLFAVGSVNQVRGAFFAGLTLKRARFESSTGEHFFLFGQMQLEDVAIHSAAQQVLPYGFIDLRRVHVSMEGVERTAVLGIGSDDPQEFLVPTDYTDVLVEGGEIGIELHAHRGSMTRVTVDGAANGGLFLGFGSEMRLSDVTVRGVQDGPTIWLNESIAWGERVTVQTDGLGVWAADAEATLADVRVSGTSSCDEDCVGVAVQRGDVALRCVDISGHREAGLVMSHGRVDGGRFADNGVDAIVGQGTVNSAVCAEQAGTAEWLNRIDPGSSGP